jgi:hypothetical protein
MNGRRDLNVIVSNWLVDQVGRGAPGYLDEILARTSTTRQRPTWSSLERWLPVQLTISQRLRPMPPLFRIAAVGAVLALIVAAALIAAGGAHRPLPHFGAQANGTFTYVDGSTLKLASADGVTTHGGAAIPAGSDSLTFSPNGTRIAYRTTGTVPSIVMADADGSHPMSITGNLAAAATAQAGVSPFAFSPDGARVVFTSQIDADARAIEIVNTDGTYLTEVFPRTSQPLVDRFDPAWSPDGQWIAFFSHDLGTDTTKIELVHPDGTGGHVLDGATPDPANLEIAWSPDPARSLLAYVKGGDALGGAIAIRELTTSKESIAGSGLWISWSPDAKNIAWWGSFSQVAPVGDVLAGRPASVGLFPRMDGATCAAHPELRGKAICGPAQWSPDSTLVYGTDVSGTMILIKSADGNGPLRTIQLDHPVDITNGPNGALAWQAIAP